MSPSNSHHWTPDVYVSFEASDVKTFTSLLFTRLEQVGIGYFRSYNERDRLLREAIHQARFAIVVFSTNYANSSRRLKELVNILRRRGLSEYPSFVVIPITLGINTAKPLKLKIGGEAKEALEKLDERDATEWRGAIAKVEGIPGYDLDRDAKNNVSELINKIVERLFNEIWSLYSSKVFGPFGSSSEKSWHCQANDETHDGYNDFINSVNSVVNGRNSGEVKLNKGQHVISFSGYFKEASRRIQHLTFRTTDDHTLGTRPTDGRPEDFSVPLPRGAGKVIEFFGSRRADGSVTSVGARVKLTRVKLPPQVSCPVGLFGSRRGTKWDAEQLQRCATVKGIAAVRDAEDEGDRCIRTVAFLYDKVEERWQPHGSDGNWSKLIIKATDEYLSSISGYCNYKGITSLTFLTNKKNTLTIGEGKGSYFSSPTTGYEIVGFYGWSEENFLHGIGAYYKSKSDILPIESIGPFGGGIPWDDGKFNRVKEILIYEQNNEICYLKIDYDDGSPDGCTIVHGNDTGELRDKKIKVDLKHGDEYLKSISGYMRDDGSIESLTFYTNKKTETIGKHEGGKYFGYPSNESQIVGFYGTWGKALNSIGVYASAKPSKCTPSTSSGGDRRKEKHSNVVGYRVTKVGEKENVKVGSITFMYENNGSLVEGSRHGGGDPSSGKWVMLNFPEERLLYIEGYYQGTGETIIHDLQFITTRDKTILPYASRGDPKSCPELFTNSQPFMIPDVANQGRRIVGFSVRAGEHLHSIEVLLES